MLNIVGERGTLVLNLRYMDVWFLYVVLTLRPLIL